LQPASHITLRMALACGLLLGGPLEAWGWGGAPPPALLTKVVDGRFVHTVGELQMNITNFGLLGSFPGENLDMSWAPSAQWPAGSGVEFLHIAGLWVGARRNGLPRVSTAWPDPEFHPGDLGRDTVYTSFAGAPGGNRLQSAQPDDDADGAIDEDPLDGVDNDGDGRVDEDFAAVGNQMFRCRYRDDHPQTLLGSPDHYPLGIEVTQESYQWEQPGLAGAVALEYRVRNVSGDPLEDLYIGLYVDPDIGHRSSSRSYDDDCLRLRRQVLCVARRPANRAFNLQLVEAFDDDGDPAAAHPAPGLLGLMLLEHNTDLFAETAPLYTGVPRLHAWRRFSRIAPFDEGGEAVNDDQRYELLSRPVFAGADARARDWRYLVSIGPFQLAPGDSARVRLAFLAAADADALLALATQLAFAEEGLWLDVDEDPDTGADCAESLIYDPLRTLEWWDPCSMDPDPLVIPKGSRIWVNADCQWEATTNGLCDNFFPWCTGVGGAEYRLPWLTASAPPPPSLRVWPSESGNQLFWDNFSEQVPDALTGDYDFEGYRIWRADNWTRPEGSSEATGPPAHLWMLLDEVDLVNGLSPDRSLDLLRYQPNVDPTLVTWYSEVLLTTPWLRQARDWLPPAGFSLAEADTAIGLAREALGLPQGRCYYRLRDVDVNLGMPYFYAVTAKDHVPRFNELGQVVALARGLEGSPSNGFRLVVPQSASQPGWDYDAEAVYVVPNPATRASMAPWALSPNHQDPSGLKVEFRHLPAAACTIRIWSLAGDLVQVLQHDATAAIAVGDYAATGTQAWDLISRNGQQVVSGVYLFTVEAPGFPDKLGKFTVIR
jgi:hypothetical protein